MSRRLIIAGGGIGGLAAAVALDRAGLDVEVYERAPVFAEAGAGMSLWPNATRILRSWGLLEAVMAVGEPVTSFDLLRPSGGPISEIPMGGGNSPAVCLHRADLHRILRQALRPEQLHPSRILTSFLQAADGRVTARFADGGEADGDGLIGADGVGSVVRERLHGKASPVYRGYTIWRGIARGVEVGGKGHISETWGSGRRFGVMPIGGGLVCWYATRNGPAGRPDGPDGRQQEVLGLFRGWHGPVEDLVAATDPSQILRNDARDLPPLRRWGSGSVSLLGDAAHPITPNVGQGACMAIEDAAILAKCLAAEPDTRAALRAYERARRPRTAYVSRQSNRVGAIGQFENPLLVGARDLVARAFLWASHDMALNSVYAFQV